MKNLEKELSALLNSVSAENGSNTPDFILAQYLISCLNNFNRAVLSREAWHCRKDGQTMTIFKLTNK